MEPYLALITRINELMARKGMTMYQLACRSAIPHSTLSSILNGQTKNTGFLNIINICRGLEITLQDFFDSHLFSPENLLDN